MKINEEELKKKLSAEEYAVLREGATEPAFTGQYVDTHEDGMFHCKACGQALFSSEAKFESGTGWPSFTDPVNAEHVELISDDSHGIHRTEVRCINCGSHLGHVFDEPTPPSGLRRPGGPKYWTGKRFCINSCALDFKEK
ncbi:MAG: peptide-methionine (R)-S-oxide reductase [Candidatus Doudnabacteria bacterium RIFCSPHIGHO2_01_FULL_46_14]|uniref:peptide-methionine (R)-S-oxide reductase n=1 Tax=Candidatus Doudnabacteria bacterium RIFCSPHIGHO2_01_FULL_46_14 TaxID=1817824 RepID=A0A1F5NJA5_9BACT|nr:MAG: peptide-methionine (R)-S-oxide reductase [Candidatus Doudnabacteria bacterium RIFCSPHIGHO2_01_FULL_46_14]